MIRTYLFNGKGALVHIPVLVFLIWAVISFWLYYSDQYLGYLQPRFGILVLLSGVVFLLFAFCLLFGNRHSSHHQVDHFLPGLIVLVPVFFLFNSIDSSLGSKAFSNRILDTEVDQLSESDGELTNPIRIEQRQPKPQLDQKAVTHIYMTATLSRLLMKSKQYNNRPVKTTGKLFFRKDLDWADGVVYRFYITCCAADARPVGVFINGIGDIKFENGAWVEIKGLYHKMKIDNKYLPTVTLHSIKAIAEPPVNKQYLYFPN